MIFSLAESSEIDKITYKARNGGKGFATKFKVYVLKESTGDDFIFAGTGSYSGNRNDVIEINITKTEANRVKFVFDEAYDSWASIGEMSFYKAGEIAEIIENDLFVDSTKTAVNEQYNSLEKLQALKDKVNAYPAASLFQSELNKAEEIIRSSFPVLSIPSSQSTKLGAVIDINGTYAANDKEDGDISENVQVLGDVNFNKAGEYTLLYKVTDSDGNVTTATRTIAVVDMSDFNYLTDFNWKSTSNSYTAPKKDVSTSGNKLRLTGKDGQEVAYDRGIGAHSTSTIIYDLSDKNFDYFTSYVGVDRQMYNTVGSVSFEVYVDGIKKYDSGIMTSKEPQKYIEVDINGAKELKLVVKDGDNGNGSDHATWADTKLHYANNDSIEIDRQALDKLMEDISKLDSSKYSEESMIALNNVLSEVNTNLLDGYNQEEINGLYTKLNSSFESLEKLADFSGLTEIIDKYKVIDRDLFTEETLTILDDLVSNGQNMFSNPIISQDLVISMVQDIQDAIEKLEYKMNLSEQINIVDSALKDAIKKALNITNDTITYGDMLKLTELNADYLNIKSLDGLQYARNLATLSMTYNEISDVSYLKKLKHLENVDISDQYCIIGMANIIQDKVIIKDNVLGLDNEKMIPKEIKVRSSKGEIKILNGSDFIVDGNISINSNALFNGTNSICITYEDSSLNYVMQSIYVVRK